MLATSRRDGRDVEGAAELFAPQGVVVDPAGHVHHGRIAIAAFVALPPGTPAQVAERSMGTRQAALHGVVQSPGQVPDQIEWIVDVDRIRHLQSNHLEGWRDRHRRAHRVLDCASGIDKIPLTRMAAAPGTRPCVPGTAPRRRA